MKKVFLFLAMLLICQPKADACVGKVIYIGSVSSAEGELLSEILSTIITERTGTTVNTRYYKSQQELYEAIKAKQVDMLVENTSRAMRILNKPADPDLKRTYELVKLTYEKDKGLIWFKPFGFSNGKGGEGQSSTAPILKVEVLNNFPALPRVIGKLAGSINDETYERLVKSVQSGEKAKKVAKDFLKARKLI
jgi:glycine betaine/choline ABC-type transport system substrate-binding protein